MYIGQDMRSLPRLSEFNGTRRNAGKAGLTVANKPCKPESEYTQHYTQQDTRKTINWLLTLDLGSQTPSTGLETTPNPYNSHTAQQTNLNSKMNADVLCAWSIVPTIAQNDGRPPFVDSRRPNRTDQLLLVTCMDHNLGVEAIKQQ